MRRLAVSALLFVVAIVLLGLGSDLIRESAPYWDWREIVGVFCIIVMWEITKNLVRRWEARHSRSPA